jgi:predicted nucleotidyltransferase
MDSQTAALPDKYANVLDHFVAACQSDDRVAAAFLRGSYVSGMADAFSDLDLSLITTDAAYDSFRAGREAFIRRLGEPVFIEDFDVPHVVFFILADGAECELTFGRESAFAHIHGGPYRVLLDKTGILSGATFPYDEAEHTAQVEALRRLIYWFWHECSHFITAIGRGQRWWAYGQLEALRHTCIKLARLRHNFADPYAGDEGYFKVDKALPADQLAALEATCCPLEARAMLQAAQVIVQFYRETAPPLAQAHGIAYPLRLERVMVARVEKLQQEHHV